MLRRVMATIATLMAVATSVVVLQSPASAWQQSMFTSTQYYTHGGRLYFYGGALGVNWGCSGGGLVMDCADAKNLYGYLNAIDTVPDQVYLQTWTSFSGSALSVGIPPGGSGSPSGWTCYQPRYDALGTWLSFNLNGVQCHAQTYLAITGLTLWARGEARWGPSFDGTNISTFLSMYPA